MNIELFTTGEGSPFVVESQQAWLYASDEVLENINAYLKAFGNYAEAKRRKVDSSDHWAEVKKTEGRLRLSIRKDLWPNTRVTQQWVTGEWETITVKPERIMHYLGRDSALSKTDK